MATTLELFNKLQCDRKHWINENLAFYFKKKNFERAKQPLTYLRQDLRNRTYRCSCGHIFVPNWLEKRHPSGPLMEKGGKLWCATEVYTDCPACKKPVAISLPELKDYKGQISIYGDEAFRSQQSHHLVTYSLVAKPLQNKHHISFQNKYLALKRELNPSLDPRTWQVHCKDLMSGQKRIKHFPYKSLSIANIFKFFESLGELLHEYEDVVHKWNCFGWYSLEEKVDNHNLKILKSLVYTPLVLEIMNSFTEKSYSPKFFFEASNKDGWAEDIFKGGRLSLMWPIIANNLPIQNPTFVAPSQSIYLEIADVISYFVARYIDKRKLGVAIDEKELQPEFLGKIKYMSYHQRSGYRSITANNLPEELLLL